MTRQRRMHRRRRRADRPTRTSGATLVATKHRSEHDQEESARHHEAGQDEKKKSTHSTYAKALGMARQRRMHRRRRRADRPTRTSEAALVPTEHITEVEEAAHRLERMKGETATTFRALGHLPEKRGAQR